MTMEFSGEIIVWRGPAPYLFVGVPEDLSRQIKTLAATLTYGWGCIPVVAKAGNTEWMTSLMPKDGRYLVPIKVAVQRSEGLVAGDVVNLWLMLKGV